MGNRQMRQLRFRGQAAVSVGGREPPRAHGAERYTRLQVQSRCCVSPRHPFRLHSAALLFTLQARQPAERPEPGADRGPLPRVRSASGLPSLAHPFLYIFHRIGETFGRGVYKYFPAPWSASVPS